MGDGSDHPSAETLALRRQVAELTRALQLVALTMGRLESALAARALLHQRLPRPMRSELLTASLTDAELRRLAAESREHIATFLDPLSQKHRRLD